MSFRVMPENGVRRHFGPGGQAIFTDFRRGGVLPVPPSWEGAGPLQLTIFTSVSEAECLSELKSIIFTAMDRAHSGVHMRSTLHSSVTTAAAIIVATSAVLSATAQGAESAGEIKIVEDHQTDSPTTHLRFSIPQAQPLGAALRTLVGQANTNVMFDEADVAGKTAAPLQMQGTLNQALKQLLKDTGLEWRFLNDATVVVGVAGSLPPAAKAIAQVPGVTAARMTLAQKTSGQTANSKDESTDRVDASSGELPSVKGIPEVMVLGKKSLNVDIERTADDPQPYVVFDRAVIERSGAASLNDFLMTRLPMNAAGTPQALHPNGMGNVSGVNLRGLGTNQTLILIDGRRAAKTSDGNASGQTDINGIPLEAIERIEVLPTTASAIYGGAATGGVINIIMRRDYVGTQVSVTYDNSFDGDSAVKRYGFSSGFSLFEGKTSVLLTGSYTDSNALLTRERNFLQRGRARMNANAPGYDWPMSTGLNIKSLTGDALVLDDGTALNSLFTSVPAGYSGFASDGGAALLSNAGRFNQGLVNSSYPYVQGGANAVIVGGDPAVKYISGSVRHDFNERLKGFVEISHSQNNQRRRNAAPYLFTYVPADAPGNPFQQDIGIVQVTQQLQGTIQSSSEYDRYGVGLIIELPGAWVSSLDYTYSKSTYSASDSTPSLDSFLIFDAVATGDIDISRGIDDQGVNLADYIFSATTKLYPPLEVTTKNPALRISGPVGNLPAGRPWLSFLLEQQDSTFSEVDQFYYDEGLGAFQPERSQKVDSAYMELRVPLVSASSRIPWLREIELQLAGRWDRYTSVNASTVFYGIGDSRDPAGYVRNELRAFSPLASLRIQPIDSVAFRVTYGEGFLPPDIDQLGSPSISLANGAGGAVDPLRGNTAVGLVDIRSGGNPDLRPEESATWSAGIILTPTWAEGFRLSLDYTKIDKKDNITSFGYQQILTDEANFPGRVTRGPKLPGDPADWAGPVTALDISYINAARTQVEAYDLQLDYSLQTANYGSFTFSAIATWQTKLDVQTSPSSAVIDRMGWVSNFDTPLDLRGNVSAEWSVRQWTLGWTSRYVSSYYVANPDLSTSAQAFQVQGDGGRVPSQTYHDVFAKYRVDPGAASGKVASLLDGLQIQAGIRNLFNSRPPFDMSARGYYSYLGDPRLATYYVTVRKSF